jgi:RHS repeat-associated protein
VTQTTANPPPPPNAVPLAVSGYAYDAAHRLTSSTDALSNTTSYAYDAAGNRTSMTDPLNHTTSYAYDAINRQTSVTDALNHTTSYGYDAGNNRTGVTDALNHTTATSYDAQGRVLSVTDALSHTTSYAYDLAGRQTSETDPDNNTTGYAYDAANRLTTVTDPLNHTTSYAYDAANRKTSMTDRDGRTTNYGYDNDNRRTSETWVNGGYTANWTYDAAGQLTVASDASSAYAYGYDNAGRLTSVDNNGTPSVPRVVLSYGYDVFNNRTSLTDGLGGALSYGYDGDNRLTSLGLSLGGAANSSLTLGYDAASRLSSVSRSVSSGGITVNTSYGYDNANRLTGITHSNGFTQATLSSFTYGFDAANRLTSYSGPDGSLGYGYDNTNQLTGVTGSQGLSYSYDANGNRTMAGYHTTANELTSDPTYNYTYDAEGNLITQTRVSDGQVTSYSWDLHNRLTEVVVKDSHNTVLNDEKFTYDVNGNRLVVWLNGTQQTWTVYDGQNPYLDFSGGGTLTERYLANPKALDQLFARVTPGGTVNWYLTDNLGSIRQIVDSSANVLDALTYDPFGAVVSESNAANGDRFKFAGGEQDAVTGANHFGARYERTADGRFISQDPTGLGPDSDPYRYVDNNPTDATDPSGLEPLPPLGRNPRWAVQDGAKGAIDGMVDKLCWPAEKKARIKDHLHRLIDIAQFEWNRSCGLFGYCNEWVDEIYPKIKDMLPAASKDGITVFHYGWKTGLGRGHEAIKIHVMDDPRCKTNNGFTFYLDDGWVGGLDHVFVDAEINPKWTQKLNQIMTGGEKETLADVLLKPPIGPGPLGPYPRGPGPRLGKHRMRR